MKWQEISGSQSGTDCGCAAGAWADAQGQRQECGEGISCRGMGEVEVLLGYFASVDNAGFVWRCHGADWARCPGGLPGVCALGRLNTSTAGMRALLSHDQRRSLQGATPCLVQSLFFPVLAKRHVETPTDKPIALAVVSGNQ